MGFAPTRAQTPPLLPIGFGSACVWCSADNLSGILGVLGDTRSRLLCSRVNAPTPYLSAAPLCLRIAGMHSPPFLQLGGANRRSPPGPTWADAGVACISVLLFWRSRHDHVDEEGVVHEVVETDLAFHPLAVRPADRDNTGLWCLIMGLSQCMRCTRKGTPE